MNNFIKKSQQFLSKQLMGFFLIAIIMFWIKTYIGYRVEFHLGIENALQQILLFVNPLSSAILFLALAFFSKEKKTYKWIIRLHLIYLHGCFLILCIIVHSRTLLRCQP